MICIDAMTQGWDSFSDSERQLNETSFKYSISSWYEFSHPELSNHAIAMDAIIINSENTFDQYLEDWSPDAQLVFLSLETRLLEHLFDKEKRNEIIQEVIDLEQVSYCSEDKLLVMSALSIWLYSNDLWQGYDIEEEAPIHGSQLESRSGGARGSMILDDASPSGWSYCAGAGGGGGTSGGGTTSDSTFFRGIVKLGGTDAIAGLGSAAGLLVSTGGLAGAPNPITGIPPASWAFLIGGGTASAIGAWNMWIPQ